MYAKDFFASTPLQADPGLCFVLMPFAPEFEAVWDTVRDTVAGQPFNMICRRADDITSPGHVMTAVLDNIGRARLLIAELSGQNPNVFYELGVAHSVKDSSQVILIASDTSSVPFDLRQLRCILYGSDLAKLRASLTAVLNDLGVKQYGLCLGQGESGKLPARLTGEDHCLYEVEIVVHYIGDDGVKFGLRMLRYTAGSEPVEVRNEGHYLGVAEPAMKIPEIPWSLCYSRPSDTHARFILGRPPGWQSMGRTPDSTEPFSSQEFSDKEVLDVVVRLRKLQQREGTEFVGRRELIRELDRLFNRKTFRFEALRSCPEQRWADRLDSAYQTEKVLRGWERNVREVAGDKYPIYVRLLKEVGSYCMQMGALLFEPAVDHNGVEGHIGKTTFKAQLPAEIRFPVGPDKQPMIPNEVNNPIERHRDRAVSLMNKFGKE